MTTAHRPTFDPARGKDAQRGPAYHQRLLPAHKTLKYRQAAQGTEAETARRDLRAELLRAERKHYARKAGREDVGSDDEPEAIEAAGAGRKRSRDEGAGTPAAEDEEAEEEDYAAKRARVLAETAAIDASSESEGGGSDADSDSESDSDDDDDDEEVRLMAELAKIKRERADAAAKLAAEQAAKDEESREREIALGNPLLQPEGYGVQRRWDDDVVFKNQARGQDEKEKARGKEFVNDMLRSDFHRKFMSRYVR